MIIRIVALLVLAIGAAWLAAHNEGYALLVAPGWRAELSFNRLLLALLLAFIVFYLLLRMILVLLRLPVLAQHYRARRRREKADQALRDALLHLLEGRYTQVIKCAETAWPDGRNQGHAALLALRAAHALHDPQRISLWSARAGECGERFQPACTLTEAEMAAAKHDFHSAQKLLSSLPPAAKRQIAALRLCLRTAQGVGDWAEVLRLVQTLEKNKALLPEQAEALRARAHQEAMMVLDTPEALKKYWAALPGSAQRNPEVLRKLVGVLIAHNEGAQAARLLEDYLDTGWDSEMVLLYADCAKEDASGLIARAEAWLLRQPKDARLLQTLGRLCVRQKLWGKAQSYLQAALALRDSRSAHLDLARLLDQIGEAAQANLHFRAAAREASRAALT